MEWDPIRYSNVDTNVTLAGLYQANAETFGVKYDPLAADGERGSTDMGNVFHIIPSTHVMYDIGTKAGCHSHAFTAAAITEIAHEKPLISSKAMAMTVVDVMYNPQLMEKIRKFKDFEKSHPATH